jgi:hypothetical protein
VADIVIFDWDLSKAIQYNARNFKKPSFPIKVAISPALPIVAQIGADPLLHQRIVDAVKAEITKSALLIDSKMAFADKQVGNAPSPQQAAAELGKFMEFASMEARGAVQRAGQKAQLVWESLADQRKEYSKYKRDVGIKVVLTSAGVALSAAGVAGAAATGGASLALGIVGLIRSTVDLAKLLRDLLKEAEGIGKRVTASLEKLKERYKGSSKASVVSREVGSSILNSLLQTEVGNITRTKSDCDLWEKKLFGIRDKAHQFSSQLARLLEDADKLEKEIFSRPPNAGTQKAMKVLFELRKQIAGWPLDAVKKITPGLLDIIPKEHQRAEQGLQAQRLAKQAVGELEKKSAAWTQFFDKFFAIAVNIGLAAAGNTLGFKEAAAATEKVVETWIQTGVGLANDLAGTVNDLRS